MRTIRILCWLIALSILVWLCWLAYHSWPVAMDSVGELFDL